MGAKGLKLNDWDSSFKRVSEVIFLIYMDKFNSFLLKKLPKWIAYSTKFYRFSTNLGVKGLKLKNSNFGVLEDLEIVHIHIPAKFHGATTKTQGKNRFQPKRTGKKPIKNVGVKGLKFKNLKFRLLEALNNCFLDIHLHFNWSLTKTEQVDRFFYQILPNFDKFERKRVKIEKNQNSGSYRSCVLPRYTSVSNFIELRQQL